jgi:hypothetical protein
MCNGWAEKVATSHFVIWRQLIGFTATVCRIWATEETISRVLLQTGMGCPAWWSASTVSRRQQLEPAVYLYMFGPRNSNMR